jgi:hypothetical protein
MGAKGLPLPPWILHAILAPLPCSKGLYASTFNTNFDDADHRFAYHLGTSSDHLDAPL